VNFVKAFGLVLCLVNSFIPRILNSASKFVELIASPVPGTHRVGLYDSK
jgi:hypothetical protein